MPVLVASGADSQDIKIREGLGLVYQPVCISKGQISELFQHFPITNPINPSVWSEGIYKPTPTIIEAAQAMFQGHNVQDISRSDGGAINLARTTTCINAIVDEIKVSGEKNEDLINFFETLEEDDDVQNIFSNAEFTK